VAPEVSGISASAEPTSVLRPLREADVAAAARWYDEATVLAGSLFPLGDLLDSTNRRRTLALVEGKDQGPAGLLVVALGDPEDGWATVTLLIVSQEERELAARAVALLEVTVRLAGKHIRAAVPADVGLALYFWLRLGYRPVVADGRLWMIRDLEASPAHALFREGTGG